MLIIMLEHSKNISTTNKQQYKLIRLNDFTIFLSPGMICGQKPEWVETSVNEPSHVKGHVTIFLIDLKT